MKPMGEVVCVIKILPKEADQFDAMREAVRKAVGKIEGEQVEDIAFGIKSLNITVIVKDDQGGTETIEKKIAALPLVGDSQVTDAARLP